MSATTDLANRIGAALSADEPTPLYHQIAAVVRWEISLGRLPIGALLPPVRSLSATLGVNYHTVRRGYEELADEGVVESRRGVGVRVVRAPSSTHWTPAASDESTASWCWVLERSLSAGADLAAAILDQWQVDVGVWRLDSGPPPPGPLLAARALGDALIGRFPDREGDLHLMDLAMESSTLSTISRLAKEYACNAVLLVGDPDQAALRDLLAQLPRVGLATEHAVDLSGEAGGDSHLTVVDPEIWDGLSWEERQRPRMVPLQLRFAPGSLARAARALRWESV